MPAPYYYTGERKLKKQKKERKKVYTRPLLLYKNTRCATSLAKKGTFPTRPKHN